VTFLGKLILSKLAFIVRQVLILANDEI